MAGVRHFVAAVARWLFVAPAAILISVSLMAVTTIWKIEHTASITEDSVTFIHFAKRLGAADASWVEALRAHDQHPGYPALLLACQHIAGAWLPADPVWCWIRAGQVVNFCAGIGLVFACYGLSRSLLGRGAGLVTAWTVALAPTLVNLYAGVLSDPVALLAFVLSCRLAVRALAGGRPHDAWACGICAALGYLVRPEAMQAALAACGLLTLRTLVRPGRHDLRPVLGLVLPLVLVIVPYAALRGTLFTKSLRVLVERLPQETQSVRTAPLASATTAPDPMPLAYVRGVRRFVGGHTRNVTPAVALIAAWGLVRQRRRIICSAGHQLVAGLIAGNLVLLPAVLFLGKGYLDHRHVLPAGLVAAVYCWPGLRAASSLIARCCGGVLEMRVVAGLGLVWFAHWAVHTAIATPLHGERIGYRQAGEWLRRVEPGSVIDPSRLASYFANRDERNPWTPMPSIRVPLRCIRELARDVGVTHVVLKDEHFVEDGPTQSDIVLRELQSFPVSCDPRYTLRVRIYRVERGESAAAYPTSRPSNHRARFCCTNPTR